MAINLMKGCWTPCQRAIRVCNSHLCPGLERVCWLPPVSLEVCNCFAGPCLCPCQKLGTMMCPLQVPLLISKVHREVLSWSYSDVKAGRHLGGDLVKVPSRFNGLQHYCGVFKELLLAELQASLLQVTQQASVHQHPLKKCRQQTLY